MWKCLSVTSGVSATVYPITSLEYTDTTVHTHAILWVYLLFFFPLLERVLKLCIIHKYLEWTKKIVLNLPHTKYTRYMVVHVIDVHVLIPYCVLVVPLV